MTDSRTRAALIADIDGTLVDSNFHHAVAWSRALRECGVEGVELWRIHRAIGIGSDLLVAHVAGEEVERSSGDAIRAAESEAYGEMIDEIVPLPGARELLDELISDGVEVVLASSGKGEEVEHYVDLLGVRERADWTSSDDVEDSKPAPDLVEAALSKLSGGPAVMLGDTPWDCLAAGRAGVACAGVLTGGFPQADLFEAGAGRVFASLDEIRAEPSALLGLAHG